MRQCVNNWIRVIVLSFFVSGCGGGSGSSGGGDNSPNNLGNDPDPALPQDLQSGLFTDAPVTGLRYEQGSITGYTEDGQFQFDANSSEPVCFYLGEVRLGCSNGGAIVTPFDLSAPGQPAGLQSGYNITRLLNSLDTTDTPEITLPENINGARGVVNFAVSDGMFTTDELVIDLVNRYSPEGSLLSREQASTLIADNADVQAAISNLNQELAQSVSGITLRWNSALSGPGVLAYLESDSGGDSAENSHFYLEIDSRNSQVYLTRSTFIDALGNYVHIRWNSNGTPDRVVRNNSVFGYFNYVDTRMSNWIDTYGYFPNKTGFLIGNGGFSDRVETGFVSSQSSSELVALMNSYGTVEFTQLSMLRIASHAMAITQNVICVQGSQLYCETGMSDAVLKAIGDTNYRNELISWVPQYINPDLCLPTIEGISDGGCASSPQLDQFNIVMGLDVEEFSGMQVPDITDLTNIDPEYGLPFSAGFGLELHKILGDLHLSYTVMCESDPEFYRFSDGVYYFGERAGELNCLEPSEFPNAIYCEDIDTSYMVSCEDNGIGSLDDWPGFSEDLTFAKQVASKARGAGVGFLLTYLFDSRGGRLFSNTDYEDFVQGGASYVNDLLINPQRDLRSFWTYTTDQAAWRGIQDSVVVPMAGVLVTGADQPSDNTLVWRSYGQYQRASGEMLLLGMGTQFRIY